MLCSRSNHAGMVPEISLVDRSLRDAAAEGVSWGGGSTSHSSLQCTATQTDHHAFVHEPQDKDVCQPDNVYGSQ